MTGLQPAGIDPERRRLAEDARRERNWKRWGPYLAERQWGTVREDYSAGGTCWESFPHDHARSRAYRWGEDGLLGITDRQGRVCFALALWNGRDPILKERLFGLGEPEGNHGEDVKELYYYLDATPTSSYLKALYKYPQAEFPYARLVEENRRRSRHDPEFDLLDTGVFDDDRRPCHGDDRRYADDPHFRDLVLFYEYFHGDTGRGCGASHQTGWTALVAAAIQKVVRARAAGGS